MSSAVVMLSKSPAVDSCKTRITDRLTQQQANDLQAALIQDILDHILPCKSYDLWIAAPTSESLVYFKRFTSRLLVQCGNDLGEKMEELTHQLFSKEYEKVILIGSDMPLMTSELLCNAINQLEVQDCVVGPASDGGYYLIGFRRMISEVFHDIQWSTSNVLSETLRTLEETALPYALLPVHRDIDSWSDLLFYANETNRWHRFPKTSTWIQSQVNRKTS